MFNVFIIDDEELARDGLRLYISKNHPELNICGEAEDGYQALTQILELKPDIILLDIQIPKINGLELVKGIKKTFSWIQIIIISGYDHFEYARSAMKLGINEYLLKPVEWHELDTALGNSIDRIEQIKRDYQTTQLIYSTKQLIINQFLSHVVTVPVTKKEIDEFESQNGIFLSGAKYNVIRIKIDNMTNNISEKLNMLSEKKYAENSNLLCFIHGTTYSCLLIGDSKTDILDESFEIAQSLQHELSLLLNTNCTIGIGSPVEYLSELPLSYQRAKAVTEVQVNYNRHKILSYNDCINLDTTPIRFLSHSEIMHVAGTCGISEVNGLIEKIIPIDEKSENSNSLLFRFYQLMQLVIVLRDASENTDFKEMVGKIEPTDLLSIINSRKSTEEYIIDLFEKGRPFKNKQGEMTNTDLAEIAKSFIIDNCSDPEISLEMVAAHVGFSKNHFSTLFAQETGQTFISYLTSCRIKKAKELLTQGNRASDVTHLVGYTDPAYFSFIFKKNVGISPREFQKKSRS